MLHDIYYYQNPHISLSGTLYFLQGASRGEVGAKGSSLMTDEELDVIAKPNTYRMKWSRKDQKDWMDWLKTDLTGPGPSLPRPTEEECQAARSTEIQVEHRAYESVLNKFESSPSVEDSWIVCWQPLSAIELMRRGDMSEDDVDAIMENQKDYLRRLPNILKKMPILTKMAKEPDGYILDKDAAIFVHLSVGLILLHELFEGGQSEQQWEWIDDALRIINMPETESIPPFYEQTEYPRIAALSTKIAKALIRSMRAHRHFRLGEYEEALNLYRKTVALFEELNENIRNWGCENELPDDWLDDQWIVDYLLENDEDADVETLRPSLTFPYDMFRLERAVKAFDALIDEDSRDTNWTRLADHCRFFGKTWHLLSAPVESKNIPKQETVSESWAIAHGIVLNKMSNDDRIKELRRNRDYQIEDRLRLYFFPETWDTLPEKARRALISADREYENEHGRRPIIFDHLCNATREILVETLLKAYNEFRAKQDVVHSFAALAPPPSAYKDLNDTIQDLFYAPLFEDFLEETFNSGDRNFIKDTEKKIRKLNKHRNDAIHNHGKPAMSFEPDIRETYAEFLGVRRNGILPQLMRLRPEAGAKAKPSARR